METRDQEKERRTDTAGSALPAREPFLLGSTFFGSHLSPVTFHLPSRVTPKRLQAVRVHDPYVDEWGEQTRASIAALEEGADRHARERRLANRWTRTPGTAYRLDGDERDQPTSEWGDPVAAREFRRRVKSPSYDAWCTLVPSASSLLYLADPWHYEYIDTGKALVPIDRTSRQLLSLLTDAIAIRSRAAVMAELVRRVVGTHGAIETEPLNWLSIACGTALPTMRAAVAAGVRPRLLLADVSARALRQATQLAKSIGYTGEVTTKRLNIFDPRAMHKLGAELAEHGARPHLVDAMGIFEYTGTNLGVDPVEFLSSVWQILRPRGTLVIGQMLATRPRPDFTMGVVQWPYLELRTVAELLEITDAAELPRERTEVFLPGDGVYAVVQATKP